ncbi:MAG TPA: hypothetical protein VKE74_07085 [Gemmataceae bacterium]|nr:hypothetical protein [Gemmataceae bacterium]
MRYWLLVASVVVWASGCGGPHPGEPAREPHTPEPAIPEGFLYGPFKRGDLVRLAGGEGAVVGATDREAYREFLGGVEGNSTAELLGRLGPVDNHPLSRSGRIRLLSNGLKATILDAHDRTDQVGARVRLEGGEQAGQEVYVPYRELVPLALHPESAPFLPGRWKQSTKQAYGGVNPPELFADLAIDGFDIRIDGKRYPYSIDPGRSPMRIEIGRADEGGYLFGIYQIVEGRLWLRLGLDDRDGHPTSFDPSDRTPSVLLTFTRPNPER